ncbi:MAG: class I SAM-dependent RNA methyltransferase [Deltaproteobacteria bacterium]|nr:class I SAM-dependent RNA methyltransferase [Deltaproteobacteria bacterium]
MTPLGTEDDAHGPAGPSDSGESLTLEIERLAPTGEGVAREPSGRVVFVPFTAPGDHVRVRISEARARFARAEIETIEKPSPDRTDPACEAFGACGGCTWQHVRYEAQVKAKAAILEDALRRIGHLELPGPIEVVPCPVEYGYRIRTRVRVERGRVGYRRRRSHDIVPTKQCPILAPPLERALAELPARSRGRSGDWWLALSGDGCAHAAPMGRPPAGERNRPAPRIQLSVGGSTLECGVGSFHQGNAPLFETVAAAVVAAAGQGDAAIELFAGAGYLTLGLAKNFGRVWAVEGSPKAARDLELNVERAGARSVEVLTGSVERMLGNPPLLGAGAHADVVVIDPPREGLTSATIDSLLSLAAPRVVYLSCDPATLARDAAKLDAGYSLESVRGFDLFPQTPHVEALACFARKA